MEEKKIIESSSERIEMLLDSLMMNANYLSTELGYKSSSVIYNLRQGKFNITEKFALKVIRKFPQISYVFLTTGELPVMIEDAIAQGQANIFKARDITIDQLMLKLEVVSKSQQKIMKDMQEIKKDIKEINNKLDKKI